MICVGKVVGHSVYSVVSSMSMVLGFYTGYIMVYFFFK